MKQLQDVKYFFICVAFISGNIYENEDESLRVEIIWFWQTCAGGRMALLIELWNTRRLFLKLAYK